MTIISATLVLSVLTVLSSSAEYLFTQYQPSENIGLQTPNLYYFQQALPAPHFYNQIPFVNSYPFSYPYIYIQPDSATGQVPATRTDDEKSTSSPPRTDERLDDGEALKQIEMWKSSYTQDGDDRYSVVIPSIPSSYASDAQPRGLILLKAAKASAFASLLGSLSFTTTTKAKTKTYIYPVFG